MSSSRSSSIRWSCFLVVIVFFLLAHRSSCVKIDGSADDIPPSDSLSLSVSGIDVVVNTWPWTAATDAAFSVLSSEGSSPIDAIVAGCTKCEELQCDGTVGFGGSPDENGDTTLDASIINGDNFMAGAVASIRDVKNVIRLARAVMEHTGHTILVGASASQFASQMGFPLENLNTEQSQSIWQNWKNSHCQPNFWVNVQPDPTTSCGPYKPPSESLQSQSDSSSSSSSSDSSFSQRAQYRISKENHDTIAMIALSRNGSMSAGTSTNGANHKIPGRVGDSPLIGSGAYVDSLSGGCGGTGDGDIMQRFVPSFFAVELMRVGMAPSEAATEALKRIAKYFPSFTGALVCLNNKGDHGGAAHNWNFSYSVRTSLMNETQVVAVSPFNGQILHHPKVTLIASPQ